MRLPTTLHNRHLTIQRNVPFQERLPLKLKQTVSGKGDATNEVHCIYEMSVMFACFKDNDFNQTSCSKEIDNFQKCYAESLKSKKIKKERDAKGVIAPGERKLTHRQISALLKQFPMEK